MKEKEETDITKMTPAQRSERTFKKHVYSCLLALNKAIYDAQKAGVNIGKAAEIDCSLYFDAVRISEKLTLESVGKYMGR